MNEFPDIELLKSLEKIIFGLRVKKKTLAAAESCTGGLVSAYLTHLAGSSDVFLGSVVAYHNLIKQQLLEVKPSTLAEHGAVSQQTVEAMSIGICKLTGADFGVATTGIAGPGGGTVSKPVGTVWIAVASNYGVVSKLLNLSGDRETIRIATVAESLQLLVRQLES
jgi:PncC family amidohydrolase